MDEIDGRMIFTPQPASVVFEGVGTFKRDGNQWTYVPSPNLTPDEAARNFLAALDRLTGHNN